MLKKIIEFITHGIWQKQKQDISNPKWRWALQPFKVILYTIRGIGEHNIVVRSAAMTFYTLMSIVPIAAIVFSVVKGFGLETNFNDYLYAQFPQYSAVIDNVLDFANNLLQRTRSGILALGGLLVLLWAVMRLFANLEKSFNEIWEIKKNRSFARKFSDYVTVLIIAPILWVISNSLVIYIRSSLSPYTLSWMLDIFFGIISFVVVWLMFAFIYYVLPNTRVRFKSALVAGIAAGSVFQIYQIAYLALQSGVSQYNAIYGSFAALPLFLIWLQASWQILLFGAELSFAAQNIDQYEQEREALHMNQDLRRKVMLGAMVVIAERFLGKEGPVNSETVAHELRLPVRIVRDVIFDLENAALVASVKTEKDDKTNSYVPARDVHSLKVCDVLLEVEKCGNSEIRIDDTRQMEIVIKVIEDIKYDVCNSAHDKYLTELIAENDPK